jgi:hypothetical protein
METMTLTINLPKDVGAALENKARQSGRETTEFVEDLITKEVQTPSIDEILAPFRRQVEESGITDEEFDEFVEEIREEIYHEKLAENREN